MRLSHMFALGDLWVVFCGLRRGVVFSGRIVSRRLMRSHVRSCVAEITSHLTPSMPPSQRLALASIFSPNTAEFVAAAVSASSIPRLAGLPEVKNTDP